MSTQPLPQRCSSDHLPSRTFVSPYRSGSQTSRQSLFSGVPTGSQAATTPQVPQPKTSQAAAWPASQGSGISAQDYSQGAPFAAFSAAPPASGGRSGLGMQQFAAAQQLQQPTLLLQQFAASAAPASQFGTSAMQPPAASLPPQQQQPQHQQRAQDMGPPVDVISSLFDDDAPKPPPAISTARRSSAFSSQPGSTTFGSQPGSAALSQPGSGGGYGQPGRSNSVGQPNSSSGMASGMGGGSGGNGSFKQPQQLSTFSGGDPFGPAMLARTSGSAEHADLQRRAASPHSLWGTSAPLQLQQLGSLGNGSSGIGQLNSGGGSMSSGMDGNASGGGFGTGSGAPTRSDSGDAAGSAAPGPLSGSSIFNDQFAQLLAHAGVQQVHSSVLCSKTNNDSIMT